MYGWHLTSFRGLHDILICSKPKVTAKMAEDFQMCQYRSAAFRTTKLAITNDDGFGFDADLYGGGRRGQKRNLEDYGGGGKGSNKRLW